MQNAIRRPVNAPSDDPARAPSQRAALAISRADALVAVLLVLTLITGAYFRFTGTNWDDYAHFHPDERFLVGSVAMQMGRGWLSFTDGNEEAQRAACLARYPESGGVGGFFDARCSDWNPHNIGAGFFAYGTLPAFTAKTAGNLLNQINGVDYYTSYDDLPLVWRTLSAFYDMVTLLTVFLIGLKLHGKWVGLVAAVLYMGAVLPIQIAHFATADAMTAMWVALTVYLSVRAMLDGGWVNYALAGVFLGAAVASRANVAPVVLVVIFAAAVRLTPVLDARLPWQERSRLILHDFGGLALAGILTILAFRIFNPYAFTGPGFFGLIPNERWLNDLGKAQFETSVNNSAPPQWQWVGRPAYFFPWWNMVMWGMGLALGLTAWAGWLWSGWRWVRGKADATRNAPLFLWTLVYFAWVGGNFVMSMRYYLPMYSSLVVLAAWALVTLVMRAHRSGIAWRRVAAGGLLVAVAGYTVLWATMFTNIYRNMATFTQAGHWVWENASGDFSMRLDGRDDLPLINIALANTRGPENDLFALSTRLFPNQPVTTVFTAPADGTISTIHAPRIGATTPTRTPTTLVFRIAETGGQTVREVSLTDTFIYDPYIVGKPYDIPLDRPLEVRGGQAYTFTVEVASGEEVATTGSVWAWEGAWDEAVPVQVCTLPHGMTLADNPPPGLLSPRECNRRNASAGLITTLQFNTVWEDTEEKRDTMIRLLDQADYIIIGTNRRYDTNSRIPQRWPLTNRFYEALFAEELGFELVAKFQETFQIGNLRISDQHLPIYDAPAWLNELEAEEAFHVYDHPVQFIYKKRADYSPENVRAILNAVSLVRVPSCGMFICYDNPTLLGVATHDVRRAEQSPTELMFTPVQLQTQTEGGTWSERFNRGGAFTDDSALTVIVWWLLMIGLGVVIFPYLFVALPALSDRGYGFAKFTAIFFIGFIAWYAASANLPVWSGEGVRFITLALALGGALIAWRVRVALLAYLRARWRLLLTIEALSAVMYLAFVGVRMTNPDLWTTGFGGEKPMNFAYFNGVLRSTVFPPIDPWFAGGYINYYYFGYVIVGVPVLWLGVVPSVAYNLILPMLFSAVGMAAFSLAHSVVSAWQARSERDADEGAARRRAATSPILAGIAALLLAVVLGNLDTPRVFFMGLANLGGYSELSFENYLLDEYERRHGALPTGEAMSAIFRQAENGRGLERAQYEIDKTGRLLAGIASGFGRWVSGDRLPVNSDRWFWAPSRTITESVGGNAINEMPYFTFVYGDLHAHMIALPMMVIAMAFVFNELLLAGREQRRRSARLLALVGGGVLFGMFIAVNSWEAPTFTLFGVLGLGYAWWLSWRAITRWSLLAMVGRIGGFLVVMWLAAYPYNLWFASAYTSLRLWDGTQTPLWAYLNIHGLFLFILTALLMWETGRWLRAVRVRALRGKASLIVIGLGVVALTLIAAVVAAAMDYQAALIVLPLVLWIGVLFFRPGQSIPMQFVLVLAGLALSITLGVEVVVLEGDIGRQNTVFKFYMQAWMLFSVMGGAAVAWLVAHSGAWNGAARAIWYGVGGVLVFSAALFPLLSTPAKAVYRLADNIPPTLDGAQFMLYNRTYSDSGRLVDMAADYAAIRWLQDNVQGTPVIMEAHLSEYTWGGRISIHTGLPAVVGWNFHQRQQRGIYPMPEFVWQRTANVTNFYTTDNLDDAWRILDHFNVRYVIVAGLERARYADTGNLEKFDQMVENGWLEVVYDVGGATIYEVVPGANRDLLVTSPPERVSN